jgi:hypothetical protein
MAYNQRDMSPPPSGSSVAWQERLAAGIRIARLAVKEWRDQLRDRTASVAGGHVPMSEIQREPEPSEAQSSEAGPTAEPSPSSAPAESEPSTSGQTMGEPMDLGRRFEAELRRVKDAVVSAETAASAVGLQTTVTSGRIECDYDIEGDALVFRSVSFELEF